MQAFKSKLLKHQTTRRLVARQSYGGDVAASSGTDELRSCVHWQGKAVGAVLTFGAHIEEIASAFIDAHKLLADSALHEALHSNSVELVATFQRAIEELRDHVSAMVTEWRSKAAPIQEDLAECKENLRISDEATAEFQRYSGKLESLTEEHGLRETRGQKAGDSATRLHRNREKLQRAAEEATNKQARALKALEACAARQDEICELASVAISQVVNAFAESFAVFGAVSTSHFVTKPVDIDANPFGGQGRNVNDGQDAVNPFDDDVSKPKLHGGACVTTDSTERVSPVRVGVAESVEANPFDDDLALCQPSSLPQSPKTQSPKTARSAGESAEESCEANPFDDDLSVRQPPKQQNNGSDGNPFEVDMHK